MKAEARRASRKLFVGAILAACAKLGVMGFAATLTNGAPTSGIIIQTSFTTWFDGANTRHETRAQGETTAIHVTGETPWSAFPQCGRVVKDMKSPFLSKPHVDGVRRLFARMQGTNATKLGDEVFRGFPCWKFREVMPLGSHRSDVVFEHTNFFLFLANPDFPVPIRQGSPAGWNTNADVLEIKFALPVPPDLFVCPTNLKPTRPFRIPNVPFEIELRETRRSVQWGWSTVKTNFLSSDGDTVTKRHVLIHRDSKGERTRGPTTDIKPFHQGIIACNYPMGPPYWASVRKLGEETILGMKADVLDSDVLGRRYWVVDHPVLGAFTIKWGMGGDTPETNEVLRLEVQP